MPLVFPPESFNVLVYLLRESLHLQLSACSSSGCQIQVDDCQSRSVIGEVVVNMAKCRYRIAGNFRLEKIFAFFAQARRGRKFFLANYFTQ